MTLQLPDDLERFVVEEVRSGRFTSPDAVIAAAVRLLRQREEAEDARALAGIRRGLEDVRAGRTQPASAAIDDIRRDLIRS
ncbi:MAG TPA: type II toxin-antitoxin system ParD family antitoxin [Isosphaeraceae bacterium]|jgi:putative addiction module CopG family antidote|nr:type II toxin-antitoxin system ParD family antitoxin [Isosphaeraceae bacterium]